MPETITLPARDVRYWHTYFCDMIRQKVRRLAKACWAKPRETWTVLPQWRRAAAKSTPEASTENTRLSTAFLTMNASSRLRPVVEAVRGFSDEVVVGVDSKSDVATWQLCQQLQAEGWIDVLFRHENPHLTCNAALEAMVDHCSGDWILRLDDDELIEPSFAQYKQAILATQQYTHYKLPRLHLCGVRPLQWINDGYLYPDYQLRLFRNDKQLLQFPGPVGHSNISCAGPRGKLHTIHLIHLNLVIFSRAQREEKLQRYVRRAVEGTEQVRPWVHPINERVLRFEDYSYQIDLYQCQTQAFWQQLTRIIDHQRGQWEAVATTPSAPTIQPPIPATPKALPTLQSPAAVSDNFSSRSPAPMGEKNPPAVLV